MSTSTQTIHEFLSGPCVVCPPGESPFESTITVPPGKEHLACSEKIDDDWRRGPEWLEVRKQEVTQLMAHRIAQYILEHYDPVRFERRPDGSIHALLQLNLRVVNTVDHVAKQFEEHGHRNGLAEGIEREKERNRRGLMRYLANEGLI